MLIAFLAVLGVDLIVIIALLAAVVSRKRWVLRQPGVFRGAIRVTSGEIEGLRPKWIRGYGRWVRDVLVWTKAPLLFRNEVIGIDEFGAERAASSREFKRMGDHPVVLRLRIGTATVEIAARDEDRELACGPYRQSDEATGAA